MVIDSYFRFDDDANIHTVITREMGKLHELYEDNGENWIDLRHTLRETYW